MPETTTGTSVYQVGVVMVPVSDQDRALEFYVGTLGFEKRADVPMGDGSRWVEVAPAGGAARISLVQPREGTTQPGGEARIALSTKDVRADHAELRERGVDVDAEIMDVGEPVPPMFWFRDQDGNSLIVVQD